jgi:TolB protein
LKHVSTHAPAWRAGLGIVAAASLLLTGCSSSSNSTAAQSSPASPARTAAPATPPAATPAVTDGAERAIGDVPWPQVGPGWMLAVWTPVTPHMPGSQPAPGEPTSETATNVLYLVNPAGDRYSIAEFPPADGAPRLVDWSGDGSQALFKSTHGVEDTAISIDLHTGVRTSVPVHGTPAYTLPEGKVLLESTGFNGDEPGTLKRIDMAGNEQFVYPTKDLGGAGQFSGDYLESPDGRQLVLGTANLGNEVIARSDNSLVVMGNDGSIVRTLPTPMPKAMCSPVKWWAPDVVLTHCAAEGSGAEQLWKVPVDGGQPTALTAVNTLDDAPGFQGNYGNWNAYETPGGTFLPTAGACGTAFVSRLTPDGHTEKVTIPGINDSAELAGVSGDKLVIVGQVGCGGGTSLVSYDPAANTSTVLLGPPITKGGGIDSARLYPNEK